MVLAPSHRSHCGDYHRSNRSHRSNLSNLSNLSHWSDISWRNLVVLVRLSVRKVGVVDLWSHGWLSHMGLRHILGNIVNWEVTGCNSEPKSIRNIVDGLSDPVGIHVAVGSADHTIGRLGLLLGLVAAQEAVRVLTSVILSVVLGSYRRDHGLGNVVLSVVTGVGLGTGLGLR